MRRRNKVSQWKSITYCLRGRRDKPFKKQKMKTKVKRKELADVTGESQNTENSEKAKSESKLILESLVNKA